MLLVKRKLIDELYFNGMSFSSKTGGLSSVQNHLKLKLLRSLKILCIGLWTVYPQALHWCLLL